VEKVVSPPRKPVTIPILAFTLMTILSRASVMINPISKHPATFTIKVPAGNAVSNLALARLSMAYLDTEPRKPPAPM